MQVSIMQTGYYYCNRKQKYDRILINKTHKYEAPELITERWRWGTWGALTCAPRQVSVPPKQKPVANGASLDAW